ncbi:phosphonate C-P lyase system protein PhnG [Labrys wisconsinensis]|uniref:Alpha-D-ribose 1-methylphosphonate 5-triphosphate synthase subunit PhnG n=1 Tax=Labrys wisconsinensis TaxID=425677 RepID=A0ABU0JI81_9HYPH|nr:phosphonate C-P lyase system protein PhnG [Labrys wisconsinensis]MDQ0473310.1 alpha-D-ribose 1-methylphosphonate 5-triphosphate synthase subunit PhnG [Labrys wisconsinensis]
MCRVTRPDGRRWWLGVLAKCEPSALRAEWDDLNVDPAFSWLVQPQAGVIRLRGRLDRHGHAFDAGLLPVTKASLKLETGEIGMAYVPGHSMEHAGLAALLDALLQTDLCPIIVPAIERLEAARQGRAAEARRLTAATAVEFTMKAQNDL